MSPNKSKFLKGVTSGYAYMMVSMIVSLWMVPYVLQFLTKVEYGIFAIAGDLLGWLTLANLGVTSTYNSRGAQLIGENNKEELQILTSTTFFSQFITSIVIIIVGLFFSFKPEILFNEIDRLENIGLVISILVGGFFMQYVSQPLRSLLVADKQIHIDNYLKFGVLIIQTSLTILLLHQGIKLLSLAISSFIASLIVTFIAWFRVKRSFPEMKIKLKYWRTDRMKFLLKNGIWFSIGGLAGILIFRMDAFLIGKYLSLSLVASFVLNNRLYQIAEKLHGQFFNITRPYFAQMYGKGNLKGLSEIYNLVYYSSILSAFFLGVVIYFSSEWFLSWWVGPDFYLGDTINLLLCVNFIIQAAVLPNRIILATSLYKIKIHNLTRIFDGATKFIISIVLITSYGIEGILVASIVSSILFSNLSLNYLSSKLLNESFSIKLLPLFPVLLLLVTLSFNACKFILLVFFVSIVSILYITIVPALKEKRLLYEMPFLKNFL